MDDFENRAFSPMLIGENQAPFDSNEYIYELKLDGIRCLAYLWDGGMELLNKRNERLNATYPELQAIHQQVNVRCVLDGELLIIDEGKPNFFELQRRSRMSNPVKIELAARRKPVCFTAFDLLYLENSAMTDLPLIERKKQLSEIVQETPQLAISRFIENEGLALFQVSKEWALEGIVAKKKNSLYFSGKRTKDWIKMKALLDEDFVICGYFPKENRVSLILGSFDHEQLIYQSHVSMGVSHQDLKSIQELEKVERIDYSHFPEIAGAVWLEPKAVCCVTYMERTPGGGLRQPVFKGLREDKLPRECMVSS